MTVPVDVFDILEPVLVKGRSDVHLALRDRAHGDDVQTLCGRPISSSSPTMSFLTRGCPGCAERAVVAGIHGVRESQQVVVNLARFIADAGSGNEV